MRRMVLLAVGFSLAGSGAASAEWSAAGELSGSRSSMTHQNAVAKENDFSFLRTSAEVSRMVTEGRLVWVPGNEDYTLANVSHPYARPILKTFVERLGAQYHDACGQRMVVTSLTRPTSEQPRNASPLSVHPAGMAVDLRVPASQKCRSWLEDALLSMERNALLDVTREKRPPHYHVAVFPEQYGEYAVAQIRAEAEERKAELASIVSLPPVVIQLRSAEAGSSAWSSGPGMLASLLFALSALAGGAAVLIRTHERSKPSAAATPAGTQNRRRITDV